MAKSAENRRINSLFRLDEHVSIGRQSAGDMVTRADVQDM